MVDLGYGCRNIWKYRSIVDTWPNFNESPEISATKTAEPGLVLGVSVEIDKKGLKLGHWCGVYVQLLRI